LGLPNRDRKAKLCLTATDKANIKVMSWAAKRPEKRSFAQPGQYISFKCRLAKPIFGIQFELRHQIAIPSSILHRLT